jgi:hypothetical protein
MPQIATIKSLPAAFRMRKAMQAKGVEWGEDDRQAARDAVAALRRDRVDPLIDGSTSTSSAWRRSARRIAATAATGTVEQLDASKNLGEVSLICSTVACSGGGSAWGVRPGFSTSKSGWRGCRRRATTSSGFKP